MCSGDVATTVMDTDIVTDRFSRSTVPELKRYLQQRGVTVLLQEGAGCSGPSAAVHRCQLPVDPDFKGIDPVTAVDDKLKALGVDRNPGHSLASRLTYATFLHLVSMTYSIICYTVQQEVKSRQKF